MKVAIATRSVSGEIHAKLSCIAEAGFEGIELCERDLNSFTGKPEKLAETIRKLGLDIVLLQSFADLEGLRGASRSQVFDRLEHMLELTVALQTKMLLVTSSCHPEASTTTELILMDLRELAERANMHGVRVAYLALPWAKHVRSELAASDLVQAVGHPALGLGLNSALYLAGETHLTKLKTLDFAQVFHVQLADSYPTNAAAEGFSSQSWLLPGLGHLNLEAFVRLIARNGYAGAWSIDLGNGALVQDDAKIAVADSYRALVSMLDDVARREPGIDLGALALPERVYVSGFEFIEFAVGDAEAQQLTDLLASLCFRKERQHVSKSVELWRQGAVNVVVNTEVADYAHSVYTSYGPTVCDMGLRVSDAQATLARATALGTPRFIVRPGRGELEIPAIHGVGGSIMHFIDEKSNIHRLWDIDFDSVSRAVAAQPAGLRRIDHLAQTMKYEEMHSWLLYYVSTFKMSKSAMVDITDLSGHVFSQAIESLEGEVRLNLNGAKDIQTLAGSFVAERCAAGVQHIAFATDDIFETSALLGASDFARLKISPDYYANLQEAFDLSDDFVGTLQDDSILYDQDEAGEYFQIYSVPVFNGFFFEVVERRNGYAGYGAKNAPIRLEAQRKYLHTAQAGHK